MKSTIGPASMVLLAVLSALSATSAVHISLAGRDVALWKPNVSAPPTGYPVVVFSHGFTGCNTQSTFLMEAFARAGYVVIAPNHRDATCGSARRGWSPGKLVAHSGTPSFRDPKSWSEQTYRDRYNDIEAVLNEVLNAKNFHGMLIDHDRIGIAGHSLGGYTALGVAGGWNSWKDPRIKAVLALSPHSSPFVDHGNLRLGVPVMYQGGSRDFGETPVVRRSGGAFDRSSAPKIYVEFDGAGHFAWTDLNRSYQEIINRYSVAFFDQYLRASPNSNLLTPLLTKPFPESVNAVRVEQN